MGWSEERGVEEGGAGAEITGAAMSSAVGIGGSGSPCQTGGSCLTVSTSSRGCREGSRGIGAAQGYRDTLCGSLLQPIPLSPPSSCPLLPSSHPTLAVIFPHQPLSSPRPKQRLETLPKLSLHPHWAPHSTTSPHVWLQALHRGCGLGGREADRNERRWASGSLSSARSLGKNSCPLCPCPQ